METIGTVCDKWKVPKFEQAFRKAGIKFTTEEFTGGTAIIKTISTQDIIKPIVDNVTQFFIDKAKAGGKLIEIWMEGFQVTGQSSTARQIGLVFDVDFDSAIQQYKEIIADLPGVMGVEDVKREHFFTEQAYNDRESSYMIWGCRLFDNEADARKGFG